MLSRAARLPLRHRICAVASASSRSTKYLPWRALATTASAPILDGPAVTATNRAEATLQRFWKRADVESLPEGLTITLDKRPIKTPSGKKLVIPHRKTLAATMIAAEWENQDKVLKSHALPMTSLASRAVDGLSDPDTRSEVRAALLNYLDTDTICFHESEPPALVKLQEEHWQPLLAWMRDEFAVELHAFDSLLGATQPQPTKEKFEILLDKFDEWELAAFERVTYTTKSFIIALALIHGRLSVDEAALAASVEVNSQIERWGEVEDSHDVDYHDIRRQLGSAAILLSNQ